MQSMMVLLPELFAPTISANGYNAIAASMMTRKLCMEMRANFMRRPQETAQHPRCAARRRSVSAAGCRGVGRGVVTQARLPESVRTDSRLLRCKLNEAALS